MESSFDSRFREGDVLASLELDSVNCGISLEELWQLVLPYIARLNFLLLTPSEIIKLSDAAGISIDVSQEKELHRDLDNWTRQMTALLQVLKCECVGAIFPVDGYQSLAVMHQVAGFAWTRPEDVSGMKFVAGYIRACMLKSTPKTRDELLSIVEKIGAHSDLISDNWEVRNSPSPKAQRT
jgi:hypothetical protein